MNNNGEEYYELLRKPTMEIGWYAKDNVFKFNVLKSYSLLDGKDITFEIAGFMASKKSTKLMVKMDVPITFTKEIMDYTLNETFHFLHEIGMKSIVYVHYDAASYSPFASLVKDKYNFNVAVFSTEAEARNWLRLL